MKYVRTKDKIYERILSIRTLGRDDSSKEVGVINDKGQVDEILAQGDTIEELCDMFVVWQEGCNMPVEMPLTEKEQYEKMKKIVSIGMKLKMNIWLKVAIWTDKGLIYVAKMNGKGELELL